MKKRLLLLVSLVVIATVGYGVYAWWHSQNSTSAVVYGKAPDGSVLGSTTSLTTWQTAYFDTRVTTSLRHRSTTETPTASIMGSYLLTSTNPTNTDQLGVTIGNLSDYSLDELSGVRLRLNEPATYTKVNRSYAPPGAIVFNDPGSSYETAIFWQHGNLYAAAVVSGSAADQANLEQILSDVVGNWQWN